MPQSKHAVANLEGEIPTQSHAVDPRLGVGRTGRRLCSALYFSTIAQTASTLKREFGGDVLGFRQLVTTAWG